MYCFFRPPKLAMEDFNTQGIDLHLSQSPSRTAATVAHSAEKMSSRESKLQNILNNKNGDDDDDDEHQDFEDNQ